MPSAYDDRPGGKNKKSAAFEARASMCVVRSGGPEWPFDILKSDFSTLFFNLQTFLNAIKLKSSLEVSI